MKDNELIEALKKGNTSVLKHCYEYLPMVSNYVLNNSGSKEDGLDVFQETVLAFYQNTNRDGFELTSSLSTYLVAIGKNIWSNKLREKKRKELHLESMPHIDLDSSFDDDEAETQEEVISRILKGIGSTCKSILIKYYYQKLSLESISKIMGYKSEKVTRQQKYKCMKKIRDKVNLEQMESNEFN